MDISPDDSVSAPAAEFPLSYDDTVPYAEQVPAQSEPAQSTLANRIGHTKVYLISDATATRAGKVRGENVFAFALAGLTTQ